MERVAAGHAVELAERGPGKRDAKSVLKQDLGGAQAQWADLETLDRGAIDEALESDRRRPERAACQQKADRLVRQSPDGERQCLRRRRIDPLIVVDRDQDGPLLAPSTAGSW